MSTARDALPNADVRVSGCLESVNHLPFDFAWGRYACCYVFIGIIRLDEPHLNIGNGTPPHGVGATLNIDVDGNGINGEGATSCICFKSFMLGF